MELKNQFQFTLSVRKFKEVEDLDVDGDEVYNALLTLDDNYKVSWGDGEEDYTTYSKVEASNCIRQGWWIVKN